MLFFSNCKSQKVESNAYGVMLKTLLKHTAKEVTVKETDSLQHNEENIVFLNSREKVSEEFESH